jgi:hypothetical protein
VTTDDEAPAGTGASSENLGRDSDDDRNRALSVDDILTVASKGSFCHDAIGEPFATVSHHGALLTFRGQSMEFRHWLNSQCHATYGTRPPKWVLQQALDILDGQARFDEPQRDVFLRVGHVRGVTYVDLGDAAGRAVEIDGDGYRVVDRPPVLFRRSSGMRALCTPEPGGSVYDLAPLLNLSADDFDLLVIYELSVLRPTGPYPVLDIDGEQGSAKTTASWIARSLIDPNAAALRNDPRDPRDLLVAAEHSWVLGIDNLSSMTKGLADALCRITSGTGASGRQNYSDKEEVLFTACRSVVMNGIPELLRRQDLSDRALRVECPPIPDTERRPEEEIRHEFDEVHPFVLGALFELTAQALHRKPEVTSRIKVLPRLADVAIHAEAAAPVLGWEEGKAIGLMIGGRSRSRRDAVGKDVVASTLVQQAKKYWGTKWLWFDGTATELLAELKANSSDPNELPKSANQLSGLLRGLEPALRDQGVVIHRDRVGHGSLRHLTIRFQEPLADSADDTAHPSSAS